VIGEGQAELRAVDRECVEERVRDQREPAHQRPVAPVGAAAGRRFVSRRAMQPPQEPRDQRGGERQEEQRVRLGAVEREVGHRTAARDQHVEVGQGAEHRAPGRGLAPHAPAQHRFADRGAEHRLRDRIHRRPSGRAMIA
jgi:hypothetical protein